MFVHLGDAYRVLDFKTKTVMITKDVRWIGKTYEEVFDVKIPKNLTNTDMGSSEDESEEEIFVKNLKRSDNKVSKVEKKPQPSSIIT